MSDREIVWTGFTIALMSMFAAFFSPWIALVFFFGAFGVAAYVIREP